MQVTLLALAGGAGSWRAGGWAGRSGSRSQWEARPSWRPWRGQRSRAALEGQKDALNVVSACLYVCM